MLRWMVKGIAARPEDPGTNESGAQTMIDGLTIRVLGASDRDELRKLPSRVSPASAISRFHGALTALSEPLLDRLLDLEKGQREAVVAVDDTGIAGVARFVRDGHESPIAEVAVLVADAWQHRGVARQMLDPLVTSARAAGITQLRADMLATNTAARQLFSELGSVMASRVADSHIVLTVDITGGLGSEPDL